MKPLTIIRSSLRVSDCAAPSQNLELSLKLVNIKRSNSMISDSTCATNFFALVSSHSSGNPDCVDCSGSIRNQNPVRAATDLEAWLYKNPGVILIIGGLGWKKPVVQLRNCHCSYLGRKLLSHNKGMYGAVSLFHVIDWLQGNSIVWAYARILKELRPPICALSKMMETVRQLVAHFLPHLHACVELNKLNKGKQYESSVSSYQ